MQVIGRVFCLTAIIACLIFVAARIGRGDDGDLFVVCVIKGDPNCQICTYMKVATGEVVKVTPLNPTCVGQSKTGVWTTRLSEGTPSSFSPSGVPNIPEPGGTAGSGSSGTSVYMEAGLGVMSRVLTRLFNDGGYYKSANQETAKQIKELKDNVAQRLAVLDDAYGKASKVSEISRKNFAENADKQFQATKTAISTQEGLLTQAKNDDEGVPQTILKEFASSESRSIFQFLESEQRRLEIEQSLPVQLLRSEGYSIAGSLDSYRSKVYGNLNDAQKPIKREEVKWTDTNSKSSPLRDLAIRNLGYSYQFALANSDRARLYSAALLQESQGLRLFEMRRVASFQVATLDSRGAIRFVNISAVEQIPENSIGSIIARTETRIAGAGVVRESLRKRLSGDESHIYANVQHQTSYIVEVTGVLLRNATRFLFNGDFVVSNECLEITETLLKAGFILSPEAGVARDLYEYLSGEDLLTGQKLTNEERALAGWSIIQFGSRFLHIGIGSLRDENSVLLPPEARPPKETIAEAEEIAKRGKDVWKRLPDDTGEVVTYISRNKALPPKYVTKAEAKAAGWNNSKDLSKVLSGKSIGGDVYRNVTDPRLPEAKGRIYYEADLGYKVGPRTGARVVFSNDSKIFVSPDHYQTWIEIK